MDRDTGMLRPRPIDIIGVGVAFYFFARAWDGYQSGSIGGLARYSSAISSEQSPLFFLLNLIANVTVACFGLYLVVKRK